MQDPCLPPPAVELHNALVPRIPNAEEDDPRVFLREEAKAHRLACEERERRWEVEVSNALLPIDEVKFRLPTRRRIFSTGYGEQGAMQRHFN